MEFLSTIVTGIVVAWVTSMLTVRFALSQHYRERWWERRLDAYIRVHDALSYQLRQTKAEYDSLYAFYSGEEMRKPIPGDIAEELRKNWRESERELEDAIVRGSFLLSEEAVTLLRRYQEEQRELDRQLDQYGAEIIDDQFESARSATHAFGELAKTDLQITRPRFTWRRAPR